MNKIQHVSRGFRILLQIIFIMSPCILAFYWLQAAPNPLSLFSHTVVIDFIPRGENLPTGFPVLTTLTPTIKLLGFLISLLPTSAFLAVCYFLIKLFRAYENNEIFSLQNIKYLRNVAYALFIGQLIIEPISQALLSVTLTWQHHPRFLMISFGSTNFGILLLAVLAILVSWIMLEGYKLREEQQYII